MLRYYGEYSINSHSIYSSILCVACVCVCVHVPMIHCVLSQEEHRQRLYNKLCIVGFGGGGNVYYMEGSIISSIICTGVWVYVTHPLCVSTLHISEAHCMSH